MVAFLAALPGFIQNLPYFFETLLRLMTLVERFVKWSQKNTTREFLHEVEQAIDGLEQARTADQKLASARELSGLISKL